MIEESDIFVEAENTVRLTNAECNAIRSVIYGCVGGSPDGPRGVIEAASRKIPWPDPRQYHASIEEVNSYGAKAVVVREMPTCNE